MAEVIEGELLGADVEIDARPVDEVEPAEADAPEATLTGASVGAMSGLALGGLFAAQAGEDATTAEKLGRGAVGALFGALAGATIGALVDVFTGTPSDNPAKPDPATADPAPADPPVGSPAADPAGEPER